MRLPELDPDAFGPEPARVSRRLRLAPLCSAVLLGAVALTACAAAPPPAPNAASTSRAETRVTRFTAEPHALTLKTTIGTVSIVAVSDQILRVRALREGSAGHESSWAVLAGANTPKGTLTVTDDGNVLRAATPDVHVRIEKAPFRIVFLDRADKVLSEDDPRHPMSITPEGFRVDKVMPADEHYFGLGDKAGPLDRRNMAFTNWNTDAFAWQESTDPLYKTIPFFIGVRKGTAYGIFLDCTWRSWFDFGKSARDASSFGAEGGDLDYYFIAGPEPKSVLTRYADLTGRTPLPPRWALGFQQSRYSYYPEARVYELARTLREKKIPADVIYLDIDYQKDNRPFTIDRARFPHFEQMALDLGKEGFKLIVITDLHLADAVGYPPFDEGAAGNDFVHNPDGSVYVGEVWPGKSVFPDFTWAPARAWWGTLYKDFAHMGIGGFWNDMNEPSVFKTPTKTMPLDLVHRVDGGGVASHREVHNVFGMENSRATYEGLRKLEPNRRPFVLTRATYAGGQRFAASWTGDNSSTWNHYRLSVPTLLNMGLSGYPLIGDDIGGFLGSPPPDLLTRWIELGAFNPIFRDHTQKGSRDQEPWVHGPEQLAIRRRYIETRYRLLPYLYTLAEEAARTGLPLMRPFWLEHPEVEPSPADDGRFLVGADLLLQPKLDETLDPIDGLVPAGAWYDYWTGERLTGPRQLEISPALDHLSVLVRGGAILPHQPLVQSTSETPKGPLELHVYPGPDCHGALYLDDGDTFEYEKGAFLRLALTCAEASGSVKATIAPAEGAYVPWFSSLAFVIYGAPSAPKEVTIAAASGTRTVRDFVFDAAKKTVTVTAPYDKAGETVTITY